MLPSGVAWAAEHLPLGNRRKLGERSSSIAAR